VTYLFRFFLSSIVSIDQTGDKDDGEAALAMGMRLYVPNPPVVVLAICDLNDFPTAKR